MADTLIHRRVAEARAGTNPSVIARLRSGWAVLGDAQVVHGYCLLLPDPVVPSLNDLPREARLQFLDDMARIGDVLLRLTGATRINYEILGNSEPELHAHIFPRYASEAPEHRTKPVWFYDWNSAVPYSAGEHGSLQTQLRAALSTGA